MFGGYVFKGEIQSCYSEEKPEYARYTDFFYVEPYDREFTVNKPLICLVFEDGIDMVK